MTNDNEFLSKLSELEAFDVAQSATAAGLFQILNPFVRSGHVRRIVDLGCGNGSVLKTLADLFRNSWDNGGAPDWTAKEPLLLRGIDKEKLWSNDEYHQNAVQVTLATRDASSEGAARREDVAVLVLGHTIFGLFKDEANLKTFIGQWRAALWVVAVHRAWDDALANIRKSPHQAVNEPLPFDMSSWCLRMIQAGDEQVKWGVWCKNQLTWKLETDQAALDTDQLHKAFDEASYLRTHQYEHYSGWGPMESSLYVHEDDELCRRWNNAYYASVAGWLKDLCDPTGNIAQSLKLYAVHCAAVVLPFDPIHTFARYSALGQGEGADSSLFNCDNLNTQMVLEEPKQHQTKYHTAFGLYSSILAPVASMQAFPLSAVAAYEMAEVDRVFERVELTLLTSGSGQAYFLVPIFVGSLPLGVLVLQFDQTFPEADTDPAVYRACLVNLHNQFKQALSQRDVMRERVVRPLVRTIDLAVTREDLPDVVARLRRNATRKPWKSWLLAPPAKLIAGLSVTKKEDEELDALFATEIALASRDVFWAISAELERWGFFGNKTAAAPSSTPMHEMPTEAHRDIIISKEFDREGTLIKVANGTEDQHSLNVIRRTAWWFLLIRKASTLGEDASKEVADAFNDLKALYCRGLSNTAPQFRFSVRRLRLMAGLALEVEATLEQPGLVRVIEERAWYLGGEEVCGKLWSYLTAVHQFWADPSGRSVKITVTRPDEEYKITVEATYTGEPSPLSGGNSLKFIEVTKSKPPGDGLRVFGIKCTIRFKVAASGKREMMNLVVDDPSVDWRASR